MESQASIVSRYVDAEFEGEEAARARLRSMTGRSFAEVVLTPELLYEEVRRGATTVSELEWLVEAMRRGATSSGMLSDAGSGAKAARALEVWEERVKKDTELRKTVYLIVDAATGLKYVGQTVLPPEIRWLQHTGPRREELVHLRFVRSGFKNMKMYVIGTARSVEATDSAETFFMGHFGTLDDRGMNKQANREPEVYTEFESAWREVDLTEACALAEEFAASGEEMKEADIQGFAARQGLRMRYSNDVEVRGIPRKSDGKPMPAEEVGAVLSTLPRFNKTMVELLVAGGEDEHNAVRMVWMHRQEGVAGPKEAERVVWYDEAGRRWTGGPPRPPRRYNEEHACPECGGVYKSRAGWVSHRRSKHGVVEPTY